MSDIAAEDLGIEKIKVSAFDKTVLIIIAILLGIMAASHVASKAKTEERCGQTKANPCYVIYG